MMCLPPPLLLGTSSLADLADSNQTGGWGPWNRGRSGNRLRHSAPALRLATASHRYPAKPGSPRSGHGPYILGSTSSLGVMFIVPLTIILLSVALAVGLPGNSFVVWSILVKMRKRSVTALLVLNLALADLAVLLTAPFFLYSVAQGAWGFGLFGCRLFHYTCGVSMYASVLLITAMSLDRSLAVALPFVSQKVRTKAVAWWVLASIWVMSFLLAIPVIMYRNVSLRQDNQTRCFPTYSSERAKAFHLLFEALTGFLLPFLVVVASYSDIRRRLQARRFRRSRRTGRLVVLIILAFVAFWLPYHLVNLVDAGRVLAGRGAAPVGDPLFLARHVFIALAFLSSSVNPVLYACAGGGLLRSAGVGFIAKLLEGTGSEASSTRRRGTLGQTVRGAPAPSEAGPSGSLADSIDALQ
ncbi:leukotriene B4 receptor 1 [Lontra canadensis]|uniref:leukotriene B4 receptor 1 n=1 Tax=Lontra canadensis TaxID=76717 RepID=UPI0013F38ACB|nr:leukotriene B4 receptor 1 [Lontra canadensis]